MVEDKMVGSPEKFNPFKHDRGTPIGNAEDGLHLRFTKEVGQPSLVELETPETPLQKLELLLEALKSRSESVIKMDAKTPFGRSEIRRTLKRVIAKLDRVPKYLETEFEADELTPTEQSLVQTVREVVAKQVSKLTGFRVFIGMVDFAQARARAAERKQEPDSAGSTTLDRFSLPTRRWVRNAGMLFGAFAATSVAAGQGNTDLNTTDNTIDLGQNFPEYEENEERSTFEKEMAQLIADIGSIESFIERLEESIGAVDLEATRVNFEPNVVEVSSKLLQEIQPTPSPALEATSTPTQDANVRTGPGTSFEDEGDVHTNVQIIVMGSAMNGGELWYEVVAPNPDGSSVRGWVRHDLLSQPSKPVADVTEVINLPVRNPEGGSRMTLNELAHSQEPTGRQVTEFENIKIGLDLYRPILPAGTFDPGNLEVISRDGRVIAQVNDINYVNSEGQDDTNEAGSMIAISFLPGTEPGQEDREFITPAFFGPGQYRTVLTEQAGIAGLEGVQFDGMNAASGYVRFGSNVIFNYEQATLAALAGAPQEQGLLQNSIVLRDGSFPSSDFTVDSDGQFLNFVTGERFELTQNGSIVEAKRVEGATGALNRLTAIEFPESATHLADKTQIEAQDSVVDYRVYTNPSKISKEFKITESGWDVVDEVLKVPLEKIIEHNIQTLQIPIVFSDARTKGNAPLVDQFGNFESGFYLEVQVSELLTKGINIVIINEVPLLLIDPTSTPEATPSYGMVAYEYDGNQQPSFAYRIDKNLNHGLTFYVYPGPEVFNDTNPDQDLYFAGSMVNPLIVLETIIDAQIEIENQLGKDADKTQIRQHILNSFYREKSGNPPWGSFYRERTDLLDELRGLDDQITISPTP